MPRADLRWKNDTLDPQALVKLLSVMCFPVDRRGREKMMRNLPSTVTIPRYQPGLHAAADTLVYDHWAQFLWHQSRAILAGSLCLAMAQLSAFGRTGNAAAVMKLAAELVEKWEQAILLSSPMQPVSAVPRRTEMAIRSAFDHYRSASHLWAAGVYGRIQFGEEFVPNTLHSVPRFLAFSEEIARLSTSLSWPEAASPLQLSAESLWVFLLPAALSRKAAAEVRQSAGKSPAAQPVQPDVAR